MTRSLRRAPLFAYLFTFVVFPSGETFGQDNKVTALPDPGTVLSLRGNINKVYYFEVTGSTTGVVWGSGLYTDDSALATAAVHSGAIKAGEKGVVKVTILPGLRGYPGSVRNGVRTQNWDAHGGTFRVEAAKGVAVAKPDPNAPLPDPGNLLGYRGKNNMSFRFEVRGVLGGSVWGSGIYTDDSSLATVAVHAGLLKVGDKGVVKVTILPGQDSYKGSARNGVTTSDWDRHGGSFKIEAAKK